MNDGRVRLKQESFNDGVTFLLEADVTSYCMCFLARGGQGQSGSVRQISGKHPRVRTKIKQKAVWSDVIINNSEI